MPWSPSRAVIRTCQARELKVYFFPFSTNRVDSFMRICFLFDLFLQGSNAVTHWFCLRQISPGCVMAMIRMNRLGTKVSWLVERGCSLLLLLAIENDRVEKHEKNNSVFCFIFQITRLHFNHRLVVSFCRLTAERPSLMLYGGTIASGRSGKGEDLDIVSTFEADEWRDPEKVLMFSKELLVKNETILRAFFPYLFQSLGFLRNLFASQKLPGGKSRAAMIFAQCQAYGKYIAGTITDEVSLAKARNNEKAKEMNKMMKLNLWILTYFLYCISLFISHVCFRFSLICYMLCQHVATYLATGEVRHCSQSMSWSRCLWWNVHSEHDVNCNRGFWAKTCRVFSKQPAIA